MGRKASVSSAGTHASQPGARPDVRTLRLAAAAGIKLGNIRARRVTEKDLVIADVVLAMDRGHLHALKQMCPPEHRHKISLLLSHDPSQQLEEVPDPYYGSFDGFIEVFALMESAIIKLVSSMG